MRNCKNFEASFLSVYSQTKWWSRVWKRLSWNSFKSTVLRLYHSFWQADNAVFFLKRVGTRHSWRRPQPACSKNVVRSAARSSVIEIKTWNSGGSEIIT